MNLTNDQHRAIHTPGSLVVSAGAGSGKTRVLVERYVRLISTDSIPTDAVLAITFTEKAAREMRERVRDTVEDRARQTHDDLWQHLRAAVESARIGTIHSFCADLLRAHPGETRLDPCFRILDEVESGIMLADSVDEALREIADAQSAIHNLQSAILNEFGPPELRTTLAEMLRGGGEVRTALELLPADADSLRARWRDDLRLAQVSALAELVGSADWRTASGTILGLAPVAPAADKLGLQVIVVADWLTALAPGVMPDFTLINEIKLNVGSKKLWPSESDLANAKSALAALRDSYRAAADLLSFVPVVEIEDRAAETAIALRDLYDLSRARYAATKARADALDFDDLEAMARDLLIHHPLVRRRWRAELQAIMVDEFQDTNATQRAIIYALAGLEPPAADGSPAELFVVGDGKQSIYRFRGADVSVFQQVERDIVERWAGQRIRLDTSFRSHPSLIDWINRVGAQVFARSAPLQIYEIPFEPLRPSRPASSHPISVELHVADGAGSADERRAAEADVLARRLVQIVEGSPHPIIYDRREKCWRHPTYGDIAMLFRASSAFEPFEAALRAQGVPFLTTAGRGYYGRNEVQDLIHLLRIIDDPSDDLALVGVLRSPLFALDDATIIGLRLSHPHPQPLVLSKSEESDTPPSPDQGEESQGGEGDSPLTFARQVLADLQAMRGQATVVELLRAALERTGYLATVSGLDDGERRRVNVEKLVAAARLSGARGLRAFREYLDHLLRTETREGEAPLEGHGSVRLMTIHRSKGLEFPLVALPDLGRTAPPARARWLARQPYGLALKVRDPDDEDRLPTAMLLARRADATMERAESERLLYVALTRAQDYLLLSGPALKKSNESWIARIAAAIGLSWEDNGTSLSDDPPLAVFYGDTAKLDLSR